MSQRTPNPLAVLAWTPLSLALGLAWAIAAAGCGSRANDAEDDAGESDAGETDSSRADIPPQTLEEACAAQTTRTACDATSEMFRGEYGCLAPEVETNGCGCQWVEELTLGPEPSTCAILERRAYCRAETYRSGGFSNVDCLETGVSVEGCPVALIGYQESLDPRFSAIGVVTVRGCRSPDTGTGTPYVPCVRDSTDPICQCLRTKVDAICQQAP